MKKKPVSIKNIAEALNISVTTVSFVLNGKAKEKHISKELTQKVLDYCAKINYRPNAIAQSLRTGKSKILVFMVEDISNSFFSKLARIIEDLAYDKGYKVIFCSNENDDERSLDLINLFNFRQVDGFIIVPSPGIRDTVARLIEESTPVILLDRYFPDLESNIVIIDNHKASYDATKHLIANSYRNIAFITTETQQTQMMERLTGYETAMRDNGLQPNTLMIPFNKTATDDGKSIIKQFIRNNKDIDAIFFATNYLTLKALEVFKGEEPQLMERLGVLTFDDNEFFGISSPTITAVSQPMMEMGNELMELMLKLLDNKEVKDIPKKIVLDAELIVRESSVARTTA